jgi:regulator of cell morphogenesis and NO signaling
MKDVKEKTVAEIVSENIKTAHVFKKMGIDFCCGGNINIVEVCQKKGINPNELIENLLDATNVVSSSHDFKSWDLDFLCDFITNTHHKYVKEASIQLTQYSEKVAKVHGAHYPQVVRINEIRRDLLLELFQHMDKEERILFPTIKRMVQCNNMGEVYDLPGFGTIQNPINQMEAEHDGAGDLLKELSAITEGYNPPEGACNTFRALYAKLEEFQDDLFQHIHLENNILFPKAIALEKQIN